MNEITEALGPSVTIVLEALCGLLVAVITWGINCRTKRFTSNNTRQEAIEALEVGVERVWESTVRAIKASANPKLTDEQRVRARQDAYDLALASTVKNPAVFKLLHEMGVNGCAAIIKAIVQQRKEQ